MGDITSDTAQGGKDYDPGTSKAWAHNCVDADYLVAEMLFRGNPGAISATYNGVPMSLISSVMVAEPYMVAFGIADPDSGNHNISISWANSTNYAWVSSSWKGVDPNQPCNTPKYAYNSTTAHSITDVASGIGQVAIGLLGCRYYRNYITGDGAGQTVIKDVPNNSDTYYMDAHLSSKSGAYPTLDMSWTSYDTKTYGILAFSLQPTAGKIFSIPGIVGL
jgi:hypothetical protein